MVEDFIDDKSYLFLPYEYYDEKAIADRIKVMLRFPPASGRALDKDIENIEKGISCSLEDVIKDLENRDFIDSNRAFAPLSAASDAIVLDTSDMTIFEVVTSISKLIEEKLGLKEHE